MTATSIEWTDATWNPVRGCSRVSEGCRNCYAERLAGRFSGPGQKFARFAMMNERGARWTGKVALIPEKLDEPLRWKKPRRIFVNSMSDLFHEALTFEEINRVVRVMSKATQHTFQILTKRPVRMRQYMESRFDPGHTLAMWRPLPNVWLGVSVEDQATADERIPPLLQTPAAVRFVSYEPALGPVDFQQHHLHLDALHWIIIGGESGPGARPFDVAWARDTVRQCREAGVPVFVKQMGRWVLGDDAGFTVNHWLLPNGWAYVPPLLPSHDHGRPPEAIGFSLCDRKGGDPAQWPEDLRVREFPA